MKKKYSELKNKIIKLVEKNSKENVDISLIDELVFNYMMADKEKSDLLSGEYMKNVRKSDDDFHIFTTE